MPSYTYAVKSERLLRSRGFICAVKRRAYTGPDGCGYSLSVKGDIEKAARILADYAIPYSNIVCGGG